MREKLMQIARTAGNFFSARALSEIDQKEGHANFVTNIDREVEDVVDGSAQNGELDQGIIGKVDSLPMRFSGVFGNIASVVRNALEIRKRTQVN